MNQISLSGKNKNPESLPPKENIIKKLNNMSELAVTLLIYKEHN